MMYNTKAERDRIIESNLPLVRSRVIKLNGGVFDDDLFQMGSMGLWKAVDRFDKSRGFAFSTFAVSCIDSSIKTYKTRNKLIKPARRDDKYTYAETVSLDSCNEREDSELSYGQTIPNSINIEDEVTGRIAVEHFLNKLKPRERLVAELTITESMTQVEIAKIVGVTQSHISRVKKRVYEKYIEMFGCL